MKSFKFMDEEELQRLLEGQEDVLTPLLKNEEARFKLATCPHCKTAGGDPFVPPDRPFVQGNPLPNKILRCRNCQTEFDPYTGLIHKLGLDEIDSLTRG